MVRFLFALEGKIAQDLRGTQLSMREVYGFVIRSSRSFQRGYRKITVVVRMERLIPFRLRGNRTFGRIDRRITRVFLGRSGCQR